MIGGFMKARKRFWAVFDALLEIMSVFGMLLLAFIMLSVVWEVITRYFLGRGTIWVDEVGGYSMLFITFLGGAWLLKEEGHVEMDVVTSLLSERNRLLMRSITSLAGAFVCMVLTWSGAQVALDHLQRGLSRPTPVEPPDFPLFAIIPISCFPLFIQFLRRAHRSWVDRRTASSGKALITTRPDH